jgi:hypothetical protein
LGLKKGFLEATGQEKGFFHGIRRART